MVVIKSGNVLMLLMKGQLLSLDSFGKITDYCKYSFGFT